MNESNIPQETVDQAAGRLGKLKETIQGVIFGQDELIENAIVCMLAQGHVLLEGLPGLGKTQLVKAFSTALRADSKRIQFTPDLLPSDITGNPIIREENNNIHFEFQEGPVFTNLLLADEINRASPKTQSALLEAMAEGTVTVMGKTYDLPNPFLVFATQNPIELEGTYPLPEAQQDRFLFKLIVEDPDQETLEKILKQRQIGEMKSCEEIFEISELLELRKLTTQIYLPDVVSKYISRLIHATQKEVSETANLLRYGASPRAAIGIAAAVKAKAILDSRIYASCEDVIAVTKTTLRHRIHLSYEAKLDGHTTDSVIDKLLEEIQPESGTLPKSLSAVKM